MDAWIRFKVALINLTHSIEWIKVMEKIVVIYKSIDIGLTMFDFFGKIKAEFADLKAKVSAIDAKVEAYFSAQVSDVKADAVKVEDKAIADVTPAPVVTAVEAMAPKAE